MTRTHPPTNPGPLQVCSRHTKPGKRLEYEERIVNVDHGSFTPLVFSSTGSAGPMADTFLQRLAGKLSEKDGVSYSSTVVLPGFVAGFRSPLSVGPFCVFAEAALAKGVQHTIPSESWQSPKADWTCIEAHTEYGIMTAHTENQ